MIIFNEDKSKHIKSSAGSHHKSSRPLTVGGGGVKKQIKKKLTKANSEYLKSLGLTLKKNN